MVDSLCQLPGSIMIPKVKNIHGYGNYVVEVLSSENEDYSDYDWIMLNQIIWYKQQSNYYKEKCGKTLPALAFFHIPLPEYKDAYFDSQNIKIGERNEKECSPKYNSKMFQAMVKQGDIMATLVGHDHINDYVIPILNTYILILNNYLFIPNNYSP